MVLRFAALDAALVDSATRRLRYHARGLWTNLLKRTLTRAHYFSICRWDLSYDSRDHHIHTSGMRSAVPTGAGAPQDHQGRPNGPAWSRALDLALPLDQVALVYAPLLRLP